MRLRGQGLRHGLALMQAASDRILPWLVAAGTWGLDQVAKTLVVRFMSDGRPVVLVPGYFDLHLVTNTGGIFGLLRDLDGPAKDLVFTAIPLAAIVLMIWYGIRLPAGRAWPRVALGLILGGAAGNLQDRIVLGHVVDFLDAYVGTHHWPTFNLADSGICVGVTMLLIENFILRPPVEETSPHPPAP